MAQTENGVGVSYKLSDGTMVWVRRDTYAELTKDIDIIFGEGASDRLEAFTHSAWAGQPTMTPQQVEQVFKQDQPQAEPTVVQEPQQTFETCPVCNSTKDRWIPPGVSKRTGKAYSGFYGCPTPQCPGR